VKKARSDEILFEPASEIQEAYIWGTRRESMFDGGVGNGKTTGGLMRLLILAREFPGSRWVVARQTYKTLINTTRKTFDRVCPAHWIKRDVKESMTLQNDSEILWLHMDDLDENDLKSLEINGAFVSQAEETSPEMWDFLDGRIGRWRPKDCTWTQPCPAYLWGECNPNGHDWIYFRFHPEVIGTENPYRAYFFGATSINKRMLDRFAPGYYDSLMRKPESWKRRWVFGSRDIFEGSIHPDFKREIHVYDADKFDPFDSLDIKSCWGWFDYGLSAPTCLLLSASTSDNFHFITHEYYRKSPPGKTITIREHSAALQKIMRDNRYSVRGVYADPSVFFEDTRDRQSKQARNSVAQEYRECGLYLQRADNNEATSIANLQELMHIDSCVANPITRKPGSPRLFISSRCPNLIEQIQIQRHAESRNPLNGEKEFTEDRAEGIPDHAYDPLRYFANSSVWQAPRYRNQPPVPDYRTAPKTEKPVGGYASFGQRPHSHNWRELPRMPEVNRVAQ
jgi:hypothetical protein